MKVEQGAHKHSSVIRNYIPALDGLRAIAILLVLIFHFLGFVKMPTDFRDSHFFYQFFKSASLGVDLFFVISGFLITSILLEVKEKGGSMKSFWLRRIIRIFPLYFFYLGTLFTLSLFHFESLQISQLAFLEWIAVSLYLANFVIFFHKGLSQDFVILWSLSIEEQFYLIWPFIIKSIPTPELKRFILMCIGVAVLIRFGSYLENPQVDVHHFLLFSRMDTLLLGALLAYFRYLHQFQKLIRSTASRVWPLAILGILYFLQSHPYYEESKSAFYIGWSYLGVGLCWGIIIQLAINSKKITNLILGNRAIRFIGLISYGLYVWHPLVGKFTNVMLTRLGTPIASYSFRMFVMTITCIVVATLSYYLIEKPFLSLKKKIPYFVSTKTEI